jgi:hypothetical protein
VVQERLGLAFDGPTDAIVVDALDHGGPAHPRCARNH